MQLVNSGFLEDAEWEEEYQGVVSGWQGALQALKLYLENYFGQPRRSILVLRQSEFAYQRLLPYFLREELLAQWLTRSGAIGGAGERCELILRDGSNMSGRVLVITGREATVSWGQIHGLLEFKAFAMGPAVKMLGVRVCGWNLEAARADQIRSEMTAAVERLTQAMAASSAPPAPPPS